MDFYELCINSDNPIEFARVALAQACKDKLNKHILSCKDCDSQINNQDKVLASGNPDANVLIISDNATNNKEIIDFFNELLEYSPLNKEDIFIINSVCCVCKRKEKDTYVERLPSYEEANNCKSFVDYVLRFVRPRIIVSMGATAFNQYVPDSNLSKNINNMYYYNGIPAIITYSPSDLYTLSEYKTDDEIEEMTKLIIEALEKANNYINSIK